MGGRCGETERGRATFFGKWGALAFLSRALSKHPSRSGLSPHSNDCQALKICHPGTARSEVVSLYSHHALLVPGAKRTNLLLEVDCAACLEAAVGQVSTCSCLQSRRSRFLNRQVPRRDSYATHSRWEMEPALFPMTIGIDR